MAKQSFGAAFLVFVAMNNWLFAAPVFISAIGATPTTDGQTLIAPKGIAVDTSGNLYVVNTGNNCVHVYNSSGQFSYSWGSYGNGLGANGQFNQPQGIAVASGGIIYVVDTLNSRVEQFGLNGKSLIREIGSFGTGNGQFYYPTYAATDNNNNLYVLDAGLNRIEKFNSSGQFITSWNVTANFQGGIAIDKLNNVYAVIASTHTVQNYTTNGTLLTQFQTGANQIKNVAVDNSTNIYGVDTSQGNIIKLETNGTVLATWGSVGTNNGQFQFPSAMTVDNNGNFYVADMGNSRIQKFNKNGYFLTNWDGWNGAGQLGCPVGVAVDSGRNVYAIEQGNCRIQKFDSNANCVKMWGSAGSGNGQFLSPNAIAVDNGGNVYVADTGNNRIQKFDGNGVFLSTINYSLSSPQSVAVDSANYVYIADTQNNRIVKYDSSGTFISSFNVGNPALPALGVTLDSSNNIYVLTIIGTTNYVYKFNFSGVFQSKWGGMGTGNGQFKNATSLSVDKLNNIYVMDTGNSRVQEFNGNGQFIDTWNTYQSGSLLKPVSLASDINGNIYLVDEARNQIFVYANIFISKQPQATNVLNGGRANFSVSLSGYSPIAYQWYKNGNKIVGANLSTYTISNVSTNANGLYGVAVTNAYGSLMSSNAALTVFNSPQNLSAATIQGNSIQLQFTGTPNYPYVLQLTTNLTPPINWQGVYTNNANSNGVWSLTDSNAAVWPECFYRAMAR